MKLAIAIRVMTLVIAIRAISPIIVVHVIHTENFHSENFSTVSNWRVVATMVAVHHVMKSTIAIHVMKPDNVISVMVAIRVMKLNVVHATIVADISLDIYSTNRVGI
jgi:delta-aminolevulinic acid dehydratase/porphobilinogen synthase